MDKEINITYETLFELLRRERSREELQELGEDFFKDLLDYIISKKQILRSKESEPDVFEQKNKTEMQLQNINKILKELYEKRERKIINMSLSKSRTGSDIIDTSRLLPQEKELYDELRLVFDKYREKILMNLLNARLPASGLDTQEKGTVKMQKETDKAPTEAARPVAKEMAGKPGEKAEKRPGGERGDDESSNRSENVLVRFLTPVPKFLGRQLETYGPFDKEDMATLPAEIARVLIKKERAEEMPQ